MHPADGADTLGQGWPYQHIVYTCRPSLRIASGSASIMQALPFEDLHTLGTLTVYVARSLPSAGSHELHGINASSICCCSRNHAHHTRGGGSQGSPKWTQRSGTCRAQSPLEHAATHLPARPDMLRACRLRSQRCFDTLTGMSQAICERGSVCVHLQCSQPQHVHRGRGLNHCG